MRRRTVRPVSVGIDGAIERPCLGRAELAFEPGERRAAGKGEIDVVAGDEVRREILEIAARQLRQGDRRVDVVEADDPAGMALGKGSDRHALGHIGPDQDRVGSR